MHCTIILVFHCSLFIFFYIIAFYFFIFIIELTRGTPELIQYFIYRGSSHRRNSAVCPKFDMVWLYRSPILLGSRGVISSFKWFLPTSAKRRVGTLWLVPVWQQSQGEVCLAQAAQYTTLPESLKEIQYKNVAYQRLKIWIKDFAAKSNPYIFQSRNAIPVL